MLYIYENIKQFPEFVEKFYEEQRGEFRPYHEILVDYDVLILDRDKYTVKDIEEYLEFFKYKSLNGEGRMAFINNFDRVDRKIQNKLLKTFEENLNSQVITTNNKKGILPTILSRAATREEETFHFDYDKYQKKYRDLLNSITLSGEDYNFYIENEKETDFILKLYDSLVEKNYAKAYMLVTLKDDLPNDRVIYEIIQFADIQSSKINIEELFLLQERLDSPANKKLQLENYLVQKIGKN